MSNAMVRCCQSRREPPSRESGYFTRTDCGTVGTRHIRPRYHIRQDVLSYAHLLPDVPEYSHTRAVVTKVDHDRAANHWEGYAL
jgi:hypothetical protein